MHSTTYGKAFMSQDSKVNDLLPYLFDLVKFARSKGANGVEFLHTHLLERSFEVRGAERNNFAPREEQNLSGLLFLENGASASFSVNAELRGRHPASIEKAIVRAAKRPANPHAGPVGRFDYQAEGIGLTDARYPSIDDDAYQELTEINRPSLALQRHHHLQYLDRKLHRLFVSSRDFHAESSSTFYKLQIANRLPGLTHPIQTLACGRAFSHVGSIPFQRDIESRIEALSNTCDAPTEPLPLVLPTRVVAWLLENLAPAFDVAFGGKSRSFLSQLPDGVLGTRAVHIVDDPGVPGGVRTRAFDDRGVPPLAVHVVREGKVGNWYQTPESAHKQDIRPTGHFWGGKNQHSNLILRPGNRSRTQMLTEVPLSLELDHLNGSLDLRTGILNAKGSALLLEKGKPLGAVHNVQLNLPIQNLLGAVKEIASNQLRYGAVDSATVLTESIPLSA